MSKHSRGENQLANGIRLVNSDDKLVIGLTPKSLVRYCILFVLYMKDSFNFKNQNTENTEF